MLLTATSVGVFQQQQDTGSVWGHGFADLFQITLIDRASQVFACHAANDRPPHYPG
jgi:hypothetical protein